MKLYTKDRYWSETQGLRQICMDFYDGWSAVKKKIHQYLPQFPGETWDRYGARVSRTTLFPAYQESVDNLVGRVFQKPPVFDNVGERTEEWLQNIDNEGSNAISFFKEVFRSAYIQGMACILVDYTRNEGANTARDYEYARPYLRLIPYHTMFFTYSRVWDGQRKLNVVKILEKHTELDSNLEEKQVYRIRLLEPGYWALYEPVDEDKLEGDWRLVEEGEFVGPDGNRINEIPLIPLYIGQTGFFRAKPVLTDLAYLNQAHLQVSSDLRNSLHYSSIPLLTVAGVPKEELEQQIVSSSAVMYAFTNPAATMKWVELTGGSTGENLKYLEKIEEQMDALSIQPLVNRQVVSMTATQAAMQQEDEISELEGYAAHASRVFTKAIQYMEWWDGQKPSTEIKLQGNFELNQNKELRADALAGARNSGDISHETYLEELKKLGILSENLDIAAEIQKTQSEGLEETKRIGFVKQVPGRNIDDERNR